MSKEADTCVRRDETYTYGKRDICACQKRRRDTTQKQSCHTYGRGSGEMSKETCIYMSKEMYIHVKRDSHVTRTDEGLERLQERHVYINVKGDVYTCQKRRIYTQKKQSCHMHGRGF